MPKIFVKPAKDGLKVRKPDMTVSAISSPPLWNIFDEPACMIVPSPQKQGDRHGE